MPLGDDIEDGHKEWTLNHQFNYVVHDSRFNVLRVTDIHVRFWLKIDLHWY